MIQAELILDESGLWASLSVEGHAGAGSRGEDPVCAAVSVLSRTALRTLSAMEGVAVSAQAPERGSFAFDARCAPQAVEPFAALVAFLRIGLESVAEDFPQHCRVQIRTERRN